MGWTFDRQSSRIRRLISRRATVTVLLTQQVAINGQVLRRETGKRRIDLKSCTLR